MSSKTLEKTVRHTNFYESLAEAHMRLLGTVVVYDHQSDPPFGLEPYIVNAISNHRKDGVFRIYLQPLSVKAKGKLPNLEDIPRDHPSIGEKLDAWMEGEENKSLLIRKKMDSKHFHNFRPFPLGMLNMGAGDGRCFYLERQPQRHTQQGLVASMIMENKVGLNAENLVLNRGRISLQSEAFRACVRGEYPPAKEVLEALKSPTIKNEAVGFHRLFALIRGPMDLLFLGYKDKVVGLMPNGDFSEVRIGKEFGYTREAIEELKLFERVVQK